MAAARPKNPNMFNFQRGEELWDVPPMPWTMVLKLTGVVSESESYIGELSVTFKLLAAEGTNNFGSLCNDASVLVAGEN